MVDHAPFTRELVSPQELALVDEAIDAVPTADDNSFLEDDLIAEIAKRLTTGTAADRERRARKLMHAHSQQESIPLRIPGMRPKPEIPPEASAGIVTVYLDLNKRGMKYEEIAEMVSAHYPDLSFKTFMVSVEAALEQLQWEIDTQTILYDLFEEWDASQRAAGRPEAELIFGNFTRETGLLIPEVPQ